MKKKKEINNRGRTLNKSKTQTQVKDDARDVIENKCRRRERNSTGRRK